MTINKYPNTEPLRLSVLFEPCSNMTETYLSAAIRKRQEKKEEKKKLINDHLEHETQSAFHLHVNTKLPSSTINTI